MNLGVSFSKDYYAGALMVVIGASAAYAGMSYDVGSLTSMGAGFFPVAVGTLLAVVGILIALSAKDLPKPAPNTTDADAHSRLPDLRGAVCIIAGTLAFILLGKYGGLIPATFAIVFICALGDRTNTLFRAAALSIVMCAIALVVFSWALKLQLAPFAWG
nr:tripartite tricarboxylate transporter TctB family protein [Paraburkholderia heleia]